MRSWARSIAAVLAVGGELYFADAHPILHVFEECEGNLLPAHDFQTPVERPLEFVSATTYTDDPTIVTHQTTKEWIHSLSSTAGALLEAGLTITMLNEHEFLP